MTPIESYIERGIMLKMKMKIKFPFLLQKGKALQID